MGIGQYGQSDLSAICGTGLYGTDGMRLLTRML